VTDEIEVTKGSGNVYADLEVERPTPEERAAYLCQQFPVDQIEVDSFQNLLAATIREAESAAYQRGVEAERERADRIAAEAHDCWRETFSLLQAQADDGPRQAHAAGARDAAEQIRDRIRAGKNTSDDPSVSQNAESDPQTT